MKKYGHFMGGAMALALGITASLVSQVAAARAVANDLGPVDSVGGFAPITVTVALKLRNEEGLEPLIRAIYAKGSPQFRQYLSPEEFYSRFGPGPDTIARVTEHFTAAGLHVDRVTGTHLRLTGTTAAFEHEFQVQLHAFEAPRPVGSSMVRFVAPLRPAVVAPEVAGDVRAIFGLDTRPHYRPLLRRAGVTLPMGMAASSVPAALSPAGDPLGSWTVTDFASYYNVKPIYTAGNQGKGATIGIVTLASFTPSDAYSYWKALKLTYSSTRITQIKVDGGSGPASDEAGSDETTLDVEQSGGLAPAAAVDVYEGPNTSQGFVDAFAKAIDANKADTISSSWGNWEWFDILSQGTVTDPTTGKLTSVLKAYNDLFAQAATQGQSVYIAAGDAGAYDSTDNYPPPQYPLLKDSVVLSVDDPGVQQYVTDVGGTTLPGTQILPISGDSYTIKAEQAWGWDYLTADCASGGLDPVSCGIYPVGGGGGVSSYVALPSYQSGIAGIEKTASGQELLDYSQTPPAKVVTLPSGFAGRNVPDISLNADPDTGYLLYYTSDEGNPFITNGNGGTSFAAPQMNGVTALFKESLGTRVGFLNPSLYELLSSGKAYTGTAPPLRDITAGDNWHYKGAKGFDDATGVGVPNVANLLKALE